MKVFEHATEDEKEKLSWAHHQHRVIWTPFLQGLGRSGALRWDDAYI